VSMEKTEALVIRLADWSESSKVVTLYSRDFGKIAAVAKGAKRLKSAFEAALDLLTICNIVFIQKSGEGLDILTEAKLQKRFTAQPGKLESLYSGYYLAELLDSLTELNDPHPELFDEALLSLERIAGSAPLELAVLHWELAILQEIGQLPMLDGCAECGRPVAPDVWFDFSVAQGGLICPTCHPEADHARPLQPGTLAILNQLLNGQEASWQRLIVSPTQHRELRRMMTPTICHVLGKRPKMFSYLKFLNPFSI
jgi:DNA repair protein RecO (recombination protein O)